MNPEGASDGGQARLGYVVSQYPATNHTFILREIRKLRKMGFGIDVVSIRRPDRPMEALSSDEAEEARVTYPVLGNSAARIAGIHLQVMLRYPGRYFGGLWYALQLADLSIRQSGLNLAYFAEAVVAGHFLVGRGVRHTHTHFASTVTLLLARVFPVAFSITIHGPDEFNNVVGFHMAEKVARASFIATISRFGASQTMRASLPRYWAKVHALPLGVDPEGFAPRQDKARDTGLFQVLCVGRLAAAKAHHILLAALGRMVASGRVNVRLTLVGDGPERASLEAAVAEANLLDHVVFAGACNHDLVIEFYARTDVFAMASFAEGVPVVLMEAMAMEIPCIATWIAGIPELIRPEVDGLLVAPADPEALAGSMIRLMDDPALRMRLGQQGRRRVIEKYNLAANTERLAEVFRGVLD